MDTGYYQFCLADPLFYDRPAGWVSDQDEFVAAAPVPRGWLTGGVGMWRLLQPDGAQLPPQGWKVHVSATLDNAERVLAAVHGHCVRRRAAFKHLRSRQLLLAANFKYAPRGSSGKFVTIYPVDERELELTLTELSARLAGEAGPYVLSDLRYRDGPLYTRYGGFVQRLVDVGRSPEPAIQGPGGALEPDRREPRFSVPDWVSVPACLAESLAARRDDGGGRFPYIVTEPLHYSNGGGVYRATRRADGQPVVLKEARPHAGLDGNGNDAVHRLRHEHEVLGRLAGVPGVVEVHELVTYWEHHFLVMRAAPGMPLTQWLVRNYPQNQPEAGRRDLADYTARALAIIDRVGEVVAGVHRRGVVIGDLHPGNIMVDDADRVTLIDFEAAFDVRSEGMRHLGAPGFRAPADRTGTAVDDYPLAALRLWLFLPLTHLLELAPDKVRSWVTFVQRRFELPVDFGDRVLAELAPGPEPARGSAPVWPADPPSIGEPDWDEVRASIVEGILASATPGRLDRLFPGDPRQFEVGATGFAYGAAGVLYALHAVGAGRFPVYEEWLLDALHRMPPDRPGFYHGSHGVAAVLDGFGYHDHAGQLVDRTAAQVENGLDPSLENGLAGVGLAQLRMTDPRYHDAALAVADRLAAVLAGADRAEAEPPTAGLARGWSGAALLFVRAFEHTGAGSWLELADRAVRRDLDRCVPTAGDGLQVLDKWGRSLSYVDTGSAGVALAAAALATHAPDASGAAALPQLLRGCHSEFVVQPGLAQGRAGLLLALANAVPRHSDQPTERAISRHLSHLGWHAVGYQGAVAFPGHQLMRLSMDLATGSAGVLLALHSVTGQSGPGLPFLEVRPPATSLAT